MPAQISITDIIIDSTGRPTLHCTVFVDGEKTGNDFVLGKGDTLSINLLIEDKIRIMGGIRPEDIGLPGLIIE